MRKYDRILLGRSEVTLTVFVPWDCRNSCRFCTTKFEYRNKYPAVAIAKNTRKLKAAIEKITGSGVVTDVVFTGGEPFADVARLKELVGAISPAARNVYVNTSLSISDGEFAEAVAFMQDPECRVTGVSVSKPMVPCFDNSRMVERLAAADGLRPNVRVNSLVSGKETRREILGACEKFASSPFSELVFRADYRNVTQRTLHSADDPFFREMLGSERLDYVGSRNCLVCNSNIFRYGGKFVTYHRGVNSTSIECGKTLVVNDFVLKPDATLLYDWDLGRKVTKGMYGAVFGGGGFRMA